MPHLSVTVDFATVISNVATTLQVYFSFDRVAPFMIVIIFLTVAARRTCGQHRVFLKLYA
jgi:hypothetical protein